MEQVTNYKYLQALKLIVFSIMKAFDALELNAVLVALKQGPLDSIYAKLIKHIYKIATAYS